LNTLSIEETFTEALTNPTSLIAYQVSRDLAGRFPERYVLETESGSFDLDTFIAEGHCIATQKRGVHGQVSTDWYALDRALTHSAIQLWLEVDWNGNAIEIVRMNWPSGYCTTEFFWLIAANREVAESFFRSICELHAVVEKEVLVFEHGYWQRSKSLFKAIESASYDSIILAGELKQQIHNDFAGFFAARETYIRYGVPWKRGSLFIGPPGNGKTQMVKAVIKAMNVPCLYVKSLSGDREDGHANVRSVFARAREVTPCFLVLEDLDSLVTDLNRSVFLNELDGFAANNGIVVLATTNHPDRLDPAILERPSRFDRKYHFNLPGRPQRFEYLQMWNAELEPELKLTNAAIAATADETADFSFAYLKELMLASIVEWIQSERTNKMDAIVGRQVGLLRDQMKHAAEPAPSVIECGDGEMEDEE
jgi:hypothetical protein